MSVQASLSFKKRSSKKRRDGNVRKFVGQGREEDFNSGVDTISRRGEFPTSDGSGRARFSDKYFDYELTGYDRRKISRSNKAVSSRRWENERNNAEVGDPRFYTPRYKAVGRRPGVPAHNDRQPERSTRKEFQGSKGDQPSANANSKNRNRNNRSTILTGSKGVLGKSSTTSKTLLGA